MIPSHYPAYLSEAYATCLSKLIQQVHVIMMLCIHAASIQKLSPHDHIYSYDVDVFIYYKDYIIKIDKVFVYNLVQS